MDSLPDPGQFLLFGMGPRRRKMLYLPGGCLLDALTFEMLHAWKPVHERILPAEYRVEIEGAAIWENESGVWLEEAGQRTCLTHGDPVVLPRFESHPHAPWLRALHAEILTHLTPAGPLPNLWVYTRPWYRDGAMMLMVLKETGNLSLVEPWVMGLHKVFDRNNAGVAEADNLGQVLFMLSLFGTRQHPMVGSVLRAISDFCKGSSITGITDGAEHPVYQTKWLKLGLQALGLDDPFRIPEVYDAYSALFWMDFRQQHVPGERFSMEMIRLYPYLGWAEIHFYGSEAPFPLESLQPPLTWESQASEADYARLLPLRRLGAIPQALIDSRTCTPHTWHAAEMFLTLLENGRDQD